MKNTLQNIFIDLKSYELIQNKITVDELISFILNRVDISNIHPISIKGFLFEIEYRPDIPHLSYMYTIQGYHNIDPYENNLRKVCIYTIVKLLKPTKIIFVV